MDAGGMVSLAEQWTTVPPQHICKSQEIAEERYVEIGLPSRAQKTRSRGFPIILFVPAEPAFS